MSNNIRILSLCIDTVQCDELKPKCSRCCKLDLACKYPTRNGIPSSNKDFKQIESPLQLQMSQKSFLAAIAQPQLFNLLISDQSSALPLQPRVVQMLTSSESELLEHYLEHTSKDMTVDDGDQYALQVGIPNLAFQSKPLMRSILAFSAICKCHDIIKQFPVSYASRQEILSLLSTADRYHMESIREIQPTLSKVKHYDHILANAAMMGMYGSGSHCIRIWLTETAAPDDLALDRIAPKSCQWMSLFRAARVAFGGLVGRAGTEGNSPDKLVTPDIDTAPFSCNEQKSRSHDHLLYPIISATVSSALVKLGEKTKTIKVIIHSKMQEIGHSPDDDDFSARAAADLQACLAALELLRNIVKETSSSKDRPSNKPDHRHFEHQADSDEHFAKISPWMRRYTASITSMVPSKLPRRFIMAFIHKAPTRYLELVEEMMGFILSETGVESCLGTPESMGPEPELTHQLAMEIFAHWLVLVLLLDDVWWIGGIGAWELKQIMTWKRDASWRNLLWRDGENWWPESMLEINRQLDKHREKP